jgi:hypothetical protein
MIKIGKFSVDSSLWTNDTPATGLDLFCKHDGVVARTRLTPWSGGPALPLHLFSAINLGPVRQFFFHPRRHEPEHPLVQDFSFGRIPMRRVR